MTNYQFIQTSVKDGVATITFNRPPLNVLNLQMLEELNAALEPFVTDTKTAAVVFRAQGKAFSAGVDVADHTADKVRPMIERFHAIFRKLAAIDAVTIAAVQGSALGGGCELACFCDLVLASDKAKFGQPEVKVGVFPPVAACLLPWKIGMSRAIEMNALGETIDAAEALRIGLANRVFPAAEFDAHVDKYLASFQALSRPVVQMTKQATVAPLRGWMLAHLAEAEKLYLNELMKLSDANEGLAAFLEKRTPVWKHA